MAYSVTHVVSGSVQETVSAQRQETFVTKPRIEHKIEQPKKQKKIVDKGPDIAKLRSTLDKLVKNTRLTYDINEKLNRVIVKVIDKDTNQIIKELPDEELQRIQEHIKDAIGILFDRTI